MRRDLVCVRQMLVYENYSKFISATDTIRKMKNNVNEMKSEMDSLVKNMEGIASRMQTVNSFLGGKRAKVRGLDSMKQGDASLSGAGRSTSPCMPPCGHVVA